MPAKYLVGARITLDNGKTNTVWLAEDPSNDAEHCLAQTLALIKPMLDDWAKDWVDWKPEVIIKPQGDIFGADHIEPAKVPNEEIY